MKDNDIDPKDTGAHNPYRILLAKLTGKEVGRPRTKTACNVWRKTKREAIEEQAKLVAANTHAESKHFAALRDKIARDMFNKLPEAEKVKWHAKALEASAQIKSQWEAEKENGISTSPED